MPKEISEWKKRLIEREPDEITSVLDLEMLAPYKEKVKALEKELAALDNFLNRHFDAKTKPKREDFTDVFKNLNILGQSNMDAAAAALSDDIVERALVYMTHRLQYLPPVISEISFRIQESGKNEALELVFDYAKSIHLGIVENKKKLLWQLVEYVGIKKSAAIFEKQDLIKEAAYPQYLDILAQQEPQIRRGVENNDPDAEKVARSMFNVWYEDREGMFLTYAGREKIHREISELLEKMDDKSAYKILEKHLAMTPKDFFELMENQNRKSSE